MTIFHALITVLQALAIALTFGCVAWLFALFAGHVLRVILFRDDPPFWRTAWAFTKDIWWPRAWSRN